MHNKIIEMFNFKKFFKKKLNFYFEFLKILGFPFSFLFQIIIQTVNCEEKIFIFFCFFC